MTDARVEAALDAWSQTPLWRQWAPIKQEQLKADMAAALRAADAAAWSTDLEAAKSQGLVDIWRLPTADRPLGPVGRVPNCRWRESSGEWGYLPCITRPGEFNVLDGNLVAWRPLPPSAGGFRMSAYDETGKPEMPAHDYAVQWARDTLSGKAEGGRFQWGERNLARSYMRYRAELTEAKAEVARKDAEIEGLKQDVIAFCGPWAAQWARDTGLPAGQLHPTHYDILARCGARMVDFTRALEQKP